MCPGVGEWCKENFGLKFNHERRQIDNLSFFSKNHVLRSITINVKNQIYLFE